jgi:signal-transduction protein with cAMP-binding, CBS, and nucleotidyltransferase domain
MMLVDNKHLFMFKTPPINDLGVEPGFYLVDTFYSTDSSQIERTSEMLDDIWKRGIDIAEINTQAGTRLPAIQVEITDTITSIVQQMLKNNVDSVLIIEHNKPVGIINDRDLLREIIDDHNNPQKALAKDLMYTPLILLNANDSIVTGMKLLVEKGFNRAAIVKGGQLIGMLTK